MTAKLKSGLPLILALILLLNMTTLFLTSTFALPTTYLKILDPVEGDTLLTYTNTAPPPTEAGYPLGYVLVNVSVFDVLNLAVWQINLTWDSSMLEIAKVHISGDPSLSDIYFPEDNVFGDYPDPTTPIYTPGMIFWTVGIKATAPFTYIDGSGTLCQIKFNVTQIPSVNETLACDIHFVLEGEHAVYTKLIDVEGDRMSYTSEDGYYEYAWPPPPPPPSEGAAFYVRPQEIINSSILPPQVIQLNVTIKNVTDMYGYSFSLSYDPAILWCISLTILDVLNETNYLPVSFSVDNIEGIITVNVTYVPPAVPITTELEVPLVELMFRVTGIGATLLDINNTNLVDSLGRPIPHAVHDGFFANVIRDLAITNVVPYATWVYQGNTLKINVTVKNLGEITETLIAVEAYYEGNSLGNDAIASLNPDEQVTLTFTWNTASVTPCQNYTISAEVTAVPYEINLLNNIYSDGKVKVKLYGDINGDRVVDGQDMQLVKNAIPSYPGHPRWNPEADVNNDGVVDGMDYQLTKKKIGATC